MGMPAAAAVLDTVGVGVVVVSSCCAVSWLSQSCSVLFWCFLRLRLLSVLRIRVPATFFGAILTKGLAGSLSHPSTRPPPPASSERGGPAVGPRRRWPLSAPPRTSYGVLWAPRLGSARTRFPAR